MRKTTKQWWAAFAAALCWAGVALGADIHYVAENVGGVYCGMGYGIDGTISVSAPAEGATVKYSESAEGPWQDEPITYKDVCTERPIYFQITAEGYTTVVDSRTVTVTPKQLTSSYVWLVLPPEDYVYDGTAKTPGAACGDSYPSIITEDDFYVEFSDNVDAGTATAKFTGKGNYTGTVEEEFEILKADNEWTTEPSMAGWTYGQTPSEPASVAKDGVATVTYSPGDGSKPSKPGTYTATFTVPESKNYKELAKDVEFTIASATIHYVAENVGGVYCGMGYGIDGTISISAPAEGATVKYSESAEGPWQDEPVTYRDVCTERPIYFQITAEGYTTVVDSRTVTVTPKQLTSDYVWLVLPPEDYVYDGTEKKPDAACGDGDPSIITENDFDIAYSDNVNAGTAKAKFTGKNNYTGTVEEEFEIAKAENEWTTEPSMAGWTYGQTPSEPASAAKDGTAAVTYSPGDGTKPSKPGTYTATFTVPESKNYKELTKDVEFTIAPATIHYVAENVGGVYCGMGYGIDGTISVSAPAEGATVKYSESAEGPWQDEPITYKDVCTERPIYFRITAEGYTTIVDSRTVTVTPKTLTSDYVWLVLPPEDYVYDGTAKTPGAACGDGNPSIITEDDFAVEFSDNVDAGTAKAKFTGKNNYTGTVEEEFEIAKAENEWTTEPSMAGWTYGQTPSEPASAAKDGTATVTYSPGDGSKPSKPGTYTATFAVPESKNYKELTKDVEFTIAPATIHYAAENVGGVYCGMGYGIDGTISVSAPAEGATVKYSESAEGPWQDEPVTYRDVCTERPIYFQITAEGYTTVVDSRTVTVTPKTLTSDYVWLVLPPEDYVYDGTAKTPGAACGDGNPSIITEDDFAVEFSDNVDAGTAKATFTGKNNYAGTVEEEFEIRKATPNGGEEPGGGTVPPGGLSKFDVLEEYDGAEHTADAAAILAAWQNKYPDVTVEYALSGDAADWTAAPAAFVNVCETSIWYKVSLVNYEDFIKEVKVTITPRDIANVVIAPIDDVTYADAPVKPTPTVTDGEPSIVTEGDYDVAYDANDAPGQATLTLTGRRNYAGTTTANFTILTPSVKAAGLTAEIKWCYLRASGTYFAQLNVTCTNGLVAGISDLKYMFADRVGTDGKVEASLWNTPRRSANSNVESHDGETFRYVALDASQIEAENEAVTFGVADTSASEIPLDECTIEMYVHRRVVPQTGNEGAAKVGDFMGYISWTSGGENFSIPVVAGGSPLHAPLQRLKPLSAPLSARRLNASLAVGVPLAEDSSPYCRLAAFSVSGEDIFGVVEVGTEKDGRESRGALGANAKVALLGSATPDGSFAEVASVAVGADGSFSVKRPKDAAFFRLRIDVVDVVR